MRFSPRNHRGYCPSVSTSRQQPVAAIVVAAGSGSRLGADVPKALVQLGGKTLVEHSVWALIDGGVDEVVVVFPAEHGAAFESALAGLHSRSVRLAPGGQRRQDSVVRGLARLQHLAGRAIVVIHDAARPLVPRQVVSAVINAVAAGAEAVVPVVEVSDSIRRIDEDGSTVVPRAELRAVQTPQGFVLSTICRAHDHVAIQDVEVTDDASAAELVGAHVDLVPGHREAFKITEPADLIWAEAILQGRQQ